MSQPPCTLQAFQRLLPGVRTPLLLKQGSRGRLDLRRVFASAAATGAGSSSSSGSAANGWLLDNSSLPSSSSSNGSGLSSSYDAIMMLGGGLLPNGGMPEWVQRRLEGCLHLYHAQAALEASSTSSSGGSTASSNGSGGISSGPLAAAPLRPPIVLLGAGTPHKPPVIDAGGYVLHESTAYADYLVGRGVPAADLLKEAQSYDTVGNGYFSLLQHALPAGWR